MAIVGAVARSGVECRCFAGSSSKLSQLWAVWIPVSSSPESSCFRRGAAFPESFEFSCLRPVRFSLRFSALLLLHDAAEQKFRAPSSSSRDNYVRFEFEDDSEEKPHPRKLKLIELIVKGLGIGLIAYSFFVIRAQKPSLTPPTPKIRRLIKDDVSSGDSARRTALDSKLLNGRKVALASIVGTQPAEAMITEGGKESDRRAVGEGSTSSLCTYVNLAEDQDLLEIDEQAFDHWLLEVKDTAVKRGIQESVVVKALQGIRPSKRIMELDSSQPEVTLTLEAYLKNMINAYRVNKGVSGFQENELLLAEISSKYGVPSPVLVAIWGIESSYGGYSGNWDILRALVTLAYASEEPRRAQFFRGELLQALQIIQEGHGPQSDERLRGSWAGAMGQCQFMPSSFQAYAVDYDGDGRKDIWESRADMFASMANYLEKHGWQKGGLVAQKASSNFNDVPRVMSVDNVRCRFFKVHIPGNVDKNLLDLKVQKSVQEWTNKHKVRIDKGQPEIPPHETASLVAPDGPKGSAYLVFHNFRMIMRYNASPLYSIAVWQLALQIVEGLGSSGAQFPEFVSTLKC